MEHKTGTTLQLLREDGGKPRNPKFRAPAGFERGPTKGLPLEPALLLVAVLRELPVNPLNAELNPICYLLALLGVHHFLHVSRIRVKSLTLRLLM